MTNSAVESPVKTNAYKRVQCGRREVGFRKPLWTIALSVAMVLVNLTVCGEVSESTAAKINATISKFNLEKQNRSKVQTKIDSALLERQDGLGTVLSRMGQEETNADDVVECEITGAISDRLVELIEGHGGVVTFKSVKYGSLSCRLPVSAIESIAADKDVRRIKRIHGSLLNKSNTSQGDTAHKAQQARSTFNVSGKGVKVGVISDSARYASEMQATGDLPYTLTVLPGYEGVRYDGGERVDTGEGSGMMEIVYDLAPDAGLYFATGWGTIPQFAAAVDELSAAGCRIIVDDVSKFNESALQDSVIVDAINRFTENGGIYFSSAANSGNLTAGTSGTWEGDFSASTHSSGSISGTFHSFGQSSNVYLNELTQAGSAIILQWADPWGASSNDYDLYAFDSNGNVLAKSTDTQDGSGDPFEIIYTSGVNMRVYIAVVKYSGEGRYLRIDTARGRLQYATAGSTYGHNAADRAFSVAAAAAPTGRAFVSTDSLESYSSDGPRKVFFNHNGVKIGASGYLSTGGVTLNKPDITAADATLSRWTALAYGESSFGGTSAAAPHAAAIVALMLEANPSLTRDDVFSILTNTTFSKPSWNRNKGYGIIDAYAAVDAAKNAEPKLELGEDNKTIGAEGGSVSVTVSANVDWTVSKSAGAAWLNLSNSSGNGDGAVSFTVDRNNKTNARNATLTITGEGLTRTCAILQEGMTTPVRPVVTASDGVSSESITVKWENCARALSYSLERAESAAGNKVLLDADAKSPYVDVNVTPGKTYYYWVTAVNEVGSNESSYDSGYRSISLSLDAGGNVYTKDGGESSFSVSGNSSWTVTCADEWITLGTTSGSGSGVVSFTVEKNYDGETRYGSIVVTSGSVSKTITVTQPGRVLVVANSGSITINTGASSPSFYVSSKGKTYYGTIVGGAAVYKFDYLEIGSAVSVSVSGSRPLVIESETDMKVACDFDVSGTSTGRCGGGVGGAGGSGGSTVTGGSGGSGGTRGSGGNGYTVSSYSGTTQGQSGSSGSAGGTGYNGSAGNYGTSGSSGGKGFGSTGSAASGGSRGSGGSAGSAASSVGSAGSGGYAGSDGSAGGSGTKGNAGGAGNDGAAGSNGANAFTTALTSDVIMAGAGGGGGGGGGSGGSGGGGSGGGGGGGGGGTSQTEAKSYSGNTTYINRGVYQGAIGGLGGTGGSGGTGATSGAGGAGGTGGHGGGAIVLKAAGVLELSGCVDVSAANGSRGGSSGSSASSASSGGTGGSGTAGQGALNLQTFSSLSPSSGHKGGNGGNGGAGGNGGKGGAGGAGGYGTPGMVKLYASVLLASDGRVTGANGDNSTTASRCGGLTLATNMKSAALTAQKPTVATTIKCGEASGSAMSMIASVYDEDILIPVVGQLKTSHADSAGICDSGNYAFSQASSLPVEGTVCELTLKRLTTLFDGYDQIFLINGTSAKVGPVEIDINGAPCLIPELNVGEAWTTCVQAGATVGGSGGALPDLCFDYRLNGWPRGVFLSDSPANSNALHSFVQGSPIRLFNLCVNAGNADIDEDFDMLHEVVDANGNVVSNLLSIIDGLSAEAGSYWEGWRCPILQNLPPGDYVYRCTVDSLDLVEESDEENNVCLYEFTVTPGVEDVEIVGPDKVVYGAQGVKYTCVATYTDGSTNEVEAKWIDVNDFVGGQRIASSSKGVLSNWATRDWAVTMQAEYTYASTTWTAYKYVSIVESLIETYEVSYLPGSCGGGLAQDAAKTNDVAMTLAGAVFTRTGYKQSGWSLTDGGVMAYELGATYTANAPITLYPTWTPITYIVKFDANGGSGSMGWQLFTYDVAQNLLPNAFTRDGYDFLGWAWTPTNEVPQMFADGETIMNLAETDGCELTLFAVWAKLPSSDPVPANYVTVSSSTYYGEGLVFPFDNVYYTLSYANPSDGGAISTLVISNILDEAFDCTCAAVGSIVIADELFNDLSGVMEGHDTFTLSSGVKVDVSIVPDMATRTVVWTFTAFDSTGYGVLLYPGQTLVANYSACPCNVSADDSVGYEIGTEVYFIADGGTPLYAETPCINVIACQPDAPTGLAVSFNKNTAGDNYHVTLTWDSEWPEDTKYIIYRSDSIIIDWDNPYDEVTGVSYTDPDASLIGGSAKYYAVCACPSGPYIQGCGATIKAVVPVLLEPNETACDIAAEGVAVPEVIAVRANCEWSIEANSADTWLHIQKADASTLTYTADANDGEARSSVVQLVAGTVVVPLTFSQDAVQAVKYTVTFAPNGGECEISSKTVGAGEPVGELPVATYAGHSFVGWFTEDGMQVSANTIVNGDVTYYAHWVPVVEQPAWTPVVKGMNLTLYAQVYDKAADEYLDADGSILAAFDANGECRGKVAVMTGPNGIRVYQLTIGYESSGERGVTLKLWDAASGEIIDIPASEILYAPSQLIGKIAEPVVYQVGVLTQDITLNEGWNWISTFLTVEENDVGAFFGDFEFADDDVVKGEISSATYFDCAWYPDDFVIEPCRAYVVKKSAGGTESYEVEGFAAGGAVSVKDGWNWFGSCSGAVKTVADLRHSDGFSDDDIIKGALESATYKNGRWYPSTMQLKPGVGYLAKLANGGEFTFEVSASLANAARNAMVLNEMSNEQVAPDWKPVVKPGTFTVYARVKDAEGNYIEADGSLIAAFDGNGECRGVCAIDDGPTVKFYQLNVGVESDGEPPLTLKVWNAADGSVSEIGEKVSGNINDLIGTISAPIEYVIATGDPTPVVRTADFGMTFNGKSLSVDVGSQPSTWSVVGSSPSAGSYVESSNGFALDLGTCSTGPNISVSPMIASGKSFAISYFGTIGTVAKGVVWALRYSSDLQGLVFQQGTVGTLQLRWMKSKSSAETAIVLKTGMTSDELSKPHHYLVQVSTAGVVSLSVDGVKVNSAVNATRNFTAHTYDGLSLGRAYGGTDLSSYKYGNGVVDDFRVFTSSAENCLSDEEVAILSASFSRGSVYPELPSNPTSSDVHDALEGSQDARLQECITEPAEYNAYRQWAETVKAPGGSTAAGAQAVKDSPNAWLSFALDSATLIQTPPADGDVKVEKFEQTATAGAFDFTVGVENIPVGEDAKPGNLAKVFGIEGGSTLSPQDMSAEKVDITFGTPENGKVKFTAGPKDKTQPIFFMKVKLTP